MQMLSASQEGQLLDVSRPVIATRADIDHPHAIAAHQHPRGQLLYAIKGTMQITAGQQSRYVTAQQAVWIPPQVSHAITATGELAYRSLYIDPLAANQLANTVTYHEVSNLLRELIVEAATFGHRYQPNSAESRLIAVLYDKLQAMPHADLTLRLPTHPRLRLLCDALLQEVANDTTLQQWSQVLGLSSRSLARLFQVETGLSFIRWREQLRLMRAIEQLRQGSSVTTVALECGYASISAFSTMFRRTLKQSPRHYLKQRPH